MHEASLHAYALNQVDDRWAWRVFDVEGLQIAGGFASDQDEAQSAVAAVLEEVGPSPVRAATARR